MSKKHFSRYNNNFEPCNHGRQFIESEHFNLNNLNILLTSVDTVRQLYQLHLDLDFLESLQSALEGQLNGTAYYSCFGHEWLIRRAGKAGYRFMMQNAEEGLTIFIKHQMSKEEASGPHLKIEVSPKKIFDMGPGQLQLLMDNIAEYVSLDGRYLSTGCAVHLAVDFQGWQPALDFVNKLTCRSKRVTNHQGITELFLDNDICSVYGKGQSYLFGSANTVQMALYNKSLEVQASDKIDYFHDLWKRKTVDFDTPLYDPEQPVWRLEIRFHHSVIRQFAEMNTVKPANEKQPLNTTRLDSFSSLIPHLGGLWEYGLNNFRYDYNSRYIHPIWSVLMTESEFNQYETGFVYRRKYKTAGIGNEKNVAIAVGNLLSIYARNKFTAKNAYKFLKKSGMWRDLTGYFAARGMDKSDIYHWVEDGLIKRRLASKLAA